MSTLGTRQHPLPATPKMTPDYNTTFLRRLVWEGTVPLEIRVDSKELPANSNRGLECFFIQAPRVSYLPLLIPEIRSYLTGVVFDEAAAKVMKHEDWWFENEKGTVMKWHWSIGLLYDNHLISASLNTPTAQTLSSTIPLRLILHLASPPTEKLLFASSPETCKQAFMGQLKEADCVRWGNTKRMTGLRKDDQDGIWDGIVSHDFENYWKIASKITPAASPKRTVSPATPSPLQSRPGSADPTGPLDRDGAYNVRSVPVRIYLPDGPVLQELVPPLLEDGNPNTLAKFLSMHIPLLFPPQPPAPPPSRANPKPQAPPVPELAFALIQGVSSPPESEMAWLGACLSGADGWLNVCVGILRT